MAFVGTAQLIRQTTLQTSLFKGWITQSKWRNFWGSGEYFDWWAFPIDADSGHGDRFNVAPARADYFGVRLYKCGRALHLWGMPEAHRTFVGCVEYLLEGHPELAKTLDGICADETPGLNPLGIDLVIPSV